MGQDRGQFVLTCRELEDIQLVLGQRSADHVQNTLQGGVFVTLPRAIVEPHINKSGLADGLDLRMKLAECLRQFRY